MKNNPSHEQLSKSLDRRIRHLMIKTLQTFEEAFPAIANDSEGQRYKSGLRTVFNEMMRAQRDELLDYEVEYRPLRLSDDNILAITQTFMQSIQKVNFGFIDKTPFMEIHAAPDKVKVLDALRSELDAGLVYMESGVALLTVVGIQPCVDSVLPVMDRYRMHADVREKYRLWREALVKLYRS